MTVRDSEASDTSSEVDLTTQSNVSKCMNGEPNSAYEKWKLFVLKLSTAKLNQLSKVFVIT